MQSTADNEPIVYEYLETVDPFTATLQLQQLLQQIHTITNLPQIVVRSDEIGENTNTPTHTSFT